MKKNEPILYVIIILLIIAFIFMTIYAFKNKKDYEKSTNDLTNKNSELNEQISNLTRILENTQLTTTFYATIEEIKEDKNGNTQLLVNGLDVNASEHRGEWYIILKGIIPIMWHGVAIDISELDIGDNISIEYADISIETVYPATLSDIVSIELLDDKK